MSSRKEPCGVCGNFAYELHDGFFYCTECGTQDAGAQQTVYEDARRDDGGTYLGQRRKIQKEATKGADEQMPQQWYEWHRLNFILFNTANELIELGIAKPSFKNKLLWVWTKYLKIHVKKSHLGLTEQNDEDEAEAPTDKSSEESDDSIVRLTFAGQERGRYNKVSRFSPTLVLAIIYIALNIDKNHIQLSKLVRFANDSQISYPKRVKDILPKEFKNVVNYCVLNIAHSNISHKAMILFRKLNLGCPVLPKLKLIVDDFIQELCLPNDFKDFVFSLMEYYPCNFLDIVVNEKYLVKVPHYELHCMIYMLWGLKLLFGLDCEYELKVSEVVEKINDREKHPKAYFDSPPDSTQRLFSFREWCTYIRFRKVLLKNHCRYFNNKSSLDIDQYMGMEQQKEKKGQSKNFIEELAAEIVNKIPGGELPVGIVPLNEFKPCTTPYYTYTRVIASHIQDPDIKLALTEDFTQYSIKYLTEDFFLVDPDDREAKNILTGISDKNKEVINKEFMAEKKKYSKKMVYVKDCDNHNWIQTQPPTLDHLFKVDNLVDEPVSDLSQTKIYAENGSLVLDSSDVSVNSNEHHNGELEKLKDDTNNDKSCEKKFKEENEDNTITDEDENINIFDDDFIDLDKTKTEVIDKDMDLNKTSEFDLDKSSCLDMHPFSLNNDSTIQPGIPPDRQSLSSKSSLDSIDFNPETFDRDKIIKELVLLKCKKHKIAIPKKYKPPVFCRYKEDKRTFKSIKRTARGRQMRKDYMKSLLKNYYAHVENDIIQQVINSVNKVIQDVDQTNENIDDAEQTKTEINEANEIPPLDETIASEKPLEMEIDNSKLEEKSKHGSSSESEALFDEDSDVETYGAEFLPKKNPKFDEDKYDKRQLYLKVTEPKVPEMELDSLTKIVEQKIEKDIKDPSLLEWTKVKNRSPVDSEEEIPLSEIKQQYDIYKKVYNQKSAPKQPFFRTKTPENFKYWLTSYSKNLQTSLRRKKPMAAELKAYFPKSFSFVLETCSEVLQIGSFQLYAGLQNLEENMLISCKLRPPRRNKNDVFLLNL